MEDGKAMSKLEVLYEDNHLIVVVKPRNILSQGDVTQDLDLLTMVKEYIKEKYQKPGNVYLGLVHRLDRPVFGIMVFAKTSKAARRLSLQIQNGQMKKTYLAVVRGLLSTDEGRFVDYLKKDRNGNSFVTKEQDGKYSELDYQVLKKNSTTCESLVEIQLKTGRHHQIRVQFASRGYALCGDQRYGREDRTPLALCAYQLEFIHPTTQQVMKFQLDYPRGMYWDDFNI